MDQAIVPPLRAVGYLRRSTDQQHASLDDQRLAIEVYLSTHGFTLQRYYIDDAITGVRSGGRNGFQQMIEDAALRPRPFDVVVVYDVKRFGRMDNDETGYYRHILRLNGVRVCYASEGFTGGSIDDLIRPVKQWQARQESKDLAKVVIRGYLSKFEWRGGGWWMAGVPPFGYDREYQDSHGRFLFRVRNLASGPKLIIDGQNRVIRELGSRERLTITDLDRCRLIPSEPWRVYLVRRIFHEYVTNGLGCTAIAQRLNDEHLPTPRAIGVSCRIHPELWRYASVRDTLLNPAYAGDLAWNRSTAGKFYRIRQRQALDRSPTDADTNRMNPREDWLIKRGTHPPLVSRSLFEHAQVLMAQRRERNSRFSPDYERVFDDFRVRYVLTGLLRCAQCGNACQGTSIHRHYYFRPRKRYRARMYSCKTYGNPKAELGCRLGLVRRRVLERLVTKRLVAWYRGANSPSRRVELHRWCEAQTAQLLTSVGISPQPSELHEEAQMLFDGVQQFLARLPDSLIDHDARVRRLAFRRCLDVVTVDVPKRQLTLRIKRLPLMAATVGGVAKLICRLPKDHRDFYLGQRKRPMSALPKYDLAWHLRVASADIRSLVLAVRALCLGLGHDVVERHLQVYMGYGVRRLFAVIKVRQDHVRLFLRLHPSHVQDWPSFMRSVVAVPTQTTGLTELKICTLADLQRCQPLIKLAYERSLSMSRESPARGMQ